jgi:hypothetical protein
VQQGNIASLVSMQTVVTSGSNSFKQICGDLVNENLQGALSSASSGGSGSGSRRVLSGLRGSSYNTNSNSRSLNEVNDGGRETHSESQTEADAQTKANRESIEADAQGIIRELSHSSLSKWTDATNPISESSSPLPTSVLEERPWAWLLDRQDNYNSYSGMKLDSES